MLLRMKSVLRLASRLRLLTDGSVSSPPTVRGDAPVRLLGLDAASSGFSCRPRGLVGLCVTSILRLVSAARVLARRMISAAAVPFSAAWNR